MPPTRKPVEGPCEMAIGYDETSFAPRILLCRQPGIERHDMPNIVVPPIACDSCYAAWTERRRS